MATRPSQSWGGIDGFPFIHYSNEDIAEIAGVIEAIGEAAIAHSSQIINSEYTDHRQFKQSAMLKEPKTFRAASAARLPHPTRGI